jgi:DNA-directed RNA polymerase alpha subunit
MSELMSGHQAMSIAGFTESRYNVVQSVDFDRIATGLSVTPDFSTPEPAEHLNALLGQAGVGSLRVLTDMPLAETCNTPGLLSYVAQDWDLVISAMEQSGLTTRLPFGRLLDKEPDIGLKEVAPSKRALLCLAGHGIVSLTELQHLCLGALLSLRRHLQDDDIPSLLGRLREFQISGHCRVLPHDPDSQPIPQFHLDDSTARLSIAVLNLSSQTRKHLHYGGVHTLRELVDRIPNDTMRFQSQGVHQMWNEVKASLQCFLDSNSPRSTQTKESSPEAHYAKARKVASPDLTKNTIDVAARPELPPDDACPIDVLNLPDYARDQLGRAGIRTVRDLIATLPLGPRTIGSSTWRHIQSALRSYIASQPAGAPPAAYAEVTRGLQSRANPEPSLHADRPIDLLGLPDYARDQLSRAGIRTVRDLIATLPLGPRTIGSRTWKRIRCALDTYLATKPNDAPSVPPAELVCNVPSRVDTDSVSGQPEQSGIDANQELITTRPTVPHAIDPPTWKPTAQALDPALSSQSQVTSNVTQAEAGVDTLSFIKAEKQVMSFGPSITDRPISILDLPDSAINELKWLGYCTIGELVATLPNGPLGIAFHTWKRIQHALEAYLERPSNSPQDPTRTAILRDAVPPVKPKSPVDEVMVPPSALESLEGAKLIPDSQDMTSQLGPLPEAMEGRSIKELGLRPFALDCLQRAGFEIIGDLLTVLTEDLPRPAVPGIGKRLWEEIQEITTHHITSHTANSALEPIGTTATDDSEFRDVGSTLPAELLSNSIDELRLSVRSYNCLRRVGIDTIGQLLIVLPQGYPAVRMAGPKMWLEIEDAVADHLCQHSTSTVIAPGASTPQNNATLVASSWSYNCSILSIEVLSLPPDIAESLRDRDVYTTQILAVLPLSQLVQIPELLTLTHNDWFSVMSALKCQNPNALERARPALTNFRPKPSLLALNLTARPVNCLVRAGIFDVETLASCTLVELARLRNFGTKSIEEVLAKMRAALDSGTIIFTTTVSDVSRSEILTDPIAAESSDIPARPNESPAASPDEAQTPAVISLVQLFDAWLAQLDERQRQVLQWRYGLIDGRELRLEDIGERLHRTRERVRQIESVALRRLQGPSGQEIVRGLVAELHWAIATEGGVMSEVELCDALADIAEIGDVNPQGAVRLLLGTSEKYSKIKGIQAWCLPHLSNLVSLVGIETVSILRQALAPIAVDKLLQRFRQTQLFKDHHDELNDRFVVACIRINEKIVQLEDGSLGLETWDHHWQDDIVLALRRLGQPAHYTAIADTINASLQNGQHVTSRAVHVRLMQHPDIFVWVGCRGTYGLSEWGVERALSYVDALTQVLKDAGHPLSITEILAALVKLRPYYDEGSVNITLGTNCMFRAFPNNTYGLTEWRENDFAGELYRLRRLFENAEKVIPSKTKHEVVESLSTVDDFMAQIRGNHDG